MSDYEPTNPRETPPTGPELGKTSGPTVAEGLEGSASASSLHSRLGPGGQFQRSWPGQQTGRGSGDRFHICNGH